MQKVQRYSFQRPFIEVYRLSPNSQRWITEADAVLASPVKLMAQSQKQLLPRRALLPDLTPVPPTRHVNAGRIEHLDNLPTLWKDRSLTNISPKLKGFPEAELDQVVSNDMQQLVSIRTDALNSPLHQMRATTLMVSEADVGAFRALSAPLSLAITLAVAVGTRREGRI